ncbi:hypothetical protein D3C85_1654610 [compost metagenome]
MEVRTVGQYMLTQDKAFRTSNSVFTLSKGTIIDVRQIDYKNNKFYSDLLGDWNHWEQPLELVDKEEFERMNTVYKLK